MAAELMTETVYNVSPNLGGKMLKFKFTGATTADWVVFSDPIGACYAIMKTGAQATCAYAQMDIEATAITTTTQTTIVYENADDATQLPTSGYVMAQNEIIYYAAGGGATSGTLTGCVRGCFGTTAATHVAGANTLNILNTLIFALSTVGLCRGIADVIEE